MKNTIYLLLFALFFVQCSGPSEPEFVAIKNVKILNKTNSNVTLGADIIMFNPNIVGGKLIKTDLDVWVNGVEISKIEQNLNTTVMANSNFTIPIKSNVKLKEVLKKGGLLKGILSALSGQDLEVKYVGDIQLEVAKIKFTVPVNYKTSVPLDPE